MEPRKIIHVDMDAFFAAVEQRDFPELRGKPVAVGRPVQRGVISTASYEARKFGVHSALPSVVAQRRCPQLIFRPPRFEAYKTVSEQIRGIFYDYTDLVEPLSLDEAYLDVTSDKRGIRSATLIAKEIKQRIRDVTQLTASAGVSYNKSLAKIASDMRKPDGLFVIEPEQGMAFMAGIDIGKIHGIGQATAERLHQRGIHTGADLQALSLDMMLRLFGKHGLFFYDVVRGVDRRPVESDWVRKSISAESTFEHDLTTRFAIITELYRLEKRVIADMQRLGNTADTVTLKVRFGDFKTFTRSKTVHHPIASYPQLQHVSRSLLNQMPVEGKGIRLLGIGVSNLHSSNEPVQLDIDFNFND